MAARSEPPRRALIWGPSGSGKTTLGRGLAGALGLPHIELDALYHNKPDWNDAPDPEFRAAVSSVLEANPAGWVCDGNYSAVRDLILAHTDLVVRLRLPFRTVYPRLALRTLRRTASRELLWGTNYETWRQLASRDSMLWWGIAHWREHHRRADLAEQEVPPGVRLVVLRSPGAVEAFLRHARRSTAGGAP